MTYTEEAKQALSLKVAEKFRIVAYTVVHPYAIGEGYDSWLHDDWHTIMELCLKHGIDITHNRIHEFCYPTNHPQCDLVRYSECQSVSEAERIARLLALLEV